MRKLFFTLFSSLLLAFTYGQTNVSGGIYSNTTWTSVNSPYIVTDTVVVFPGFTLTIEPGVTVKFNDGVVIEMRQSNFIAVGNSVDSITFTSNSSTPVAGIYQGLYFNDPTGIAIDYCVFKYALKAIYTKPWITFPLTVSHSTFSFNSDCLTQNVNGTNIFQCVFINNVIGMSWSGGACNLDNCYFENNTVAARVGGNRVNNCTFINNQVGLDAGEPGPTIITDCYFCNNDYACRVADDVGGNQSNFDTITGCTFSHNHIAYSDQFTYMTENIFFENDTALSQISFHDSIDFWHRTRTHMFNNDIFNNHVGIVFRGGYSPNSNTNNFCQNSVYNIVYTSSNNGAFPDQCYCITDSTQIAAAVYDGYDDITLGLLNFTPYANCNDSVLPVDTFYFCQNIVSGINPVKFPEESFTIYPNPTSSTFTLKNIAYSEKQLLYIFNTLGKIVYLEKLFGKNEYLIDANLTKGIYFIRVSDGAKSFVKKLVFE